MVAHESQPALWPTRGVSASQLVSLRLGSPLCILARISVVSVRLCLRVSARLYASRGVFVRLGSPLVRLGESLAHPGRELTGAGGASSPEAAPGAPSNGARRQLPPRPADGVLFLHTCVRPVTRNDGERRLQSNGGRYLGQRELLRSAGVMRASAGVASM